MQFQNLVLENSDDTMVEARSLLRSWISGAGSVERGSNLDAGYMEDHDASYSDRARNRVRKDEVRQLIADAVGLPFGKDGKVKEKKGVAFGSSRRLETSNFGTSVRDPRVVMEARQYLARERREKNDALRTLQVQTMLQEKETKRESRRAAEKARVADEIVETWRIEASLRAAKERVDREMKTKRELEKQTNIEHLQQEISKKNKEKEHDIANQAQADDQKRRRALIEMKAEKKYALCMLKRLQAHFSAWHRRANETRAKTEHCLVIGNWRTLNTHWSKWCGLIRKRVNQRRANEIARTLKRDQENTIRAVRYHRSTTLSQMFVFWLGCAKVKKEKRKLLQDHERRCSKMREALDRLASDKPKKSAESITQTVAKPSEGKREPATAKLLQDDGVDCSDSVSDAAVVSNLAIQPIPKRPNDVNVPPPSTVVVQASPVVDSSLSSPEHTSLPIAEHTPDSSMPVSKRTAKIKRRIIKTDTKLLEGMANREEERRKRKNLREVRRKEKEAEEERIRAEEIKVKEELEEKERLEIAARKREEQMLLIKRRERERHVGIIATEYRNRQLLREFGLFPWLRLGSLHRQHLEAADSRYRHFMLSSVGWKPWLSKLSERRENIRRLSEGIRVKSVWKYWRCRLSDLHSTQSDADKFRVRCLIRSAWSEWKYAANQKKLQQCRIELEKDMKADRLASVLVPRRYLRLWHAMVQIQKEERWHEYRRQLLREKVKGWLFRSPLEKEQITASEEMPSAIS